MAPPPKPWQTAGAQYVNSSGEGLFSSAPNTSPTMFPRPVRTTPPPVPARPGRSVQGYGMGAYCGTSYPSYGGYGSYSGYNSYGYGGYGGYGSYGGYGGYGMNRLGFPRANNPESRFIQMAEEGSRSAFQSIESLVHAFGSVSFMLESTYNAMYSSFRAVLGVAENFGRLRELFGQFLSIFALLRWFRWLYRKGLYLLGLSGHDPGREMLWQQASEGVNPNAVDPNAARMTWPIMVFLGIVFSGPYLMWKLLGSLNIPETENKSFKPKDWYGSKEPMFSAVALYDFSAANDQELNMSVGQKIFIAPKDCQVNVPGWVVATSDFRKAGLVPSNYTKIVGRAVLKKVPPTPQPAGQEHLVPKAEGSEPVIADITPKIDNSELFARMPVNDESVPPVVPEPPHIPGPSGDGQCPGSDIPGESSSEGNVPEPVI